MRLHKMFRNLFQLDAWLRHTAEVRQSNPNQL